MKLQNFIKIQFKISRCPLNGSFGHHKHIKISYNKFFPGVGERKMTSLQYKSVIIGWHYMEKNGHWDQKSLISPTHQQNNLNPVYMDVASSVHQTVKFILYVPMRLFACEVIVGIG